MADLKPWLAERAMLDATLYEQYGKPLEQDHVGEFVAIGPQGRTVVGPRAAEVLLQAIDAFGSGNFALKRVGHRTFGRWLVAHG
jgi:hypothetical protein